MRLCVDPDPGEMRGVDLGLLLIGHEDRFALREGHEGSHRLRERCSEYTMTAHVLGVIRSEHQR
jgi:hypothetical protein